MQVLWAPWRMEYILSNEKAEGCIFCPGDDRTQDEDRLILYTGSTTMVMMNKYPYINGHLLVAPVRHVHGLELLSDDESLDLLKMVKKAWMLLSRI